MPGSRRRLLLVAEDVPNRDPRHGDGSSSISYELLTRLPGHVEVELVTWTSAVAVPAEVADRCSAVHLLLRRPHLPALARSVLGGWEVGACERATPAARRLVAGRSAAADVTLLHGPHVARLAGAVRGPAALQVIDPWSLRTSMEADMASGLRRHYLQQRVRRLQRSERGLPAGLRLLTIGARDAQAWQALLGRPVTAVPMGVSGPATTVARADEPTACFAGSLDYPPNVDSAVRLVHDIAPRVWAALPQARFVLTGRRPVPEVLALAGDRVDVRGDVPSLPDELARCHVAVFPDRFGRGVRNTVQEALAAGLPVVATAVAARELGAARELVVRDDDEGLAAEVVRLLRDGAVGAPVRVDGGWDRMVGTYLEVLGLL